MAVIHGVNYQYWVCALFWIIATVHGSRGESFFVYVDINVQ
jgi:hypothetical protein